MVSMKKINNLTKKQILCLHFNTKCKYINSICIPINFLQSKNEIEDYIVILEKDSCFFIYKYRKIIENILYISEEYLEIKTNILNRIKDYFYLDILIRENEEIINYTYDISLIREINNKNKENKNKIYSKIVISKIILELISNYEQTENFQKDENNELDEIREINKKTIESNIGILKDLNSSFNSDYIRNTSVDVMYIDIIINLIETNRLCDDAYINGVINQLDFENIVLTEIMVLKLSQTLNTNEIQKKYEIKIFSDLFSYTIINFYYVLFKYIIKNTFYKYQIEFLYKMTKITRNLIKNNVFDENKIDHNIKEKFSEFIISMTDSKYYLDLLYKNSISNYNNELSTKLSTNFYIEEKDIIQEKEKIEFNNDELIKFQKKLLNKSNFLINNKENGEFFISILKDDQNDNKESIENNDIDNKNLESNVSKFLDFLSNIKIKIKENFSNTFNLIIQLKFYNTSYNLNNNGTYNIDCYYIFYPPNEASKLSFKDDNVLVNGTNGKCQGFYYLTNEIGDDSYKEYQFNKNLDINEYMNKIDKLDENPELVSEKNKKENILSITDIGKMSGVSDLKVLEIRKILDIIYSVEFLQQISNGFYIAVGNSKIIYIYNENYKNIKQINLPNYPINICEIKSNDEMYLKIAIFFRKKEIIVISLNKFDFTYKLENYDTTSYISMILSNNDYIYSDENGTFLSTNILQNNKKSNDEKISIYSYKHGIEVDKNLILLISNNIVYGGKEKLIIYDKRKKEIVYELEGYSLNISKNSLFVMKSRDYKIIICACKKNSKYQRNGILLVNSHIEDNQEIFDFFYDTYSFEPYSFCELNYIYKGEKEINIIDTNYFIVGGFDTMKGVGMIKLYKIIFEYKAYNTKIEYMDDIIFEHANFLEFEGPIISMIQSRKTGEILVSCRDGKNYLLSPPNLNYFILNDEQETQDTSYIKKSLLNKELEIKIDYNYNQEENQKMFNFLLEKMKRQI